MVTIGSALAFICTMKTCRLGLQYPNPNRDPNLSFSIVSPGLWVADAVCACTVRARQDQTCSVWQGICHQSGISTVPSASPANQLCGVSDSV